MPLSAPPHQLRYLTSIHSDAHNDGAGACDDSDAPRAAAFDEGGREEQAIVDYGKRRIAEGDRESLEVRNSATSKAPRPTKRAAVSPSSSLRPWGYRTQQSVGRQIVI